MPILVTYHHLGAPHRSQQVLQCQPKQAGKYRNMLCNIVHIFLTASDSYSILLHLLQ